MKKLPIFATVLLALHFVSCEMCDCEDHPEQAYEKNVHLYRGSGKIYMAELEIGAMENGIVALALPENVDSRFLTKLSEMFPGESVEPFDAEAWLYTEPLRLVDSSEKHIRNLRYCYQSTIHEICERKIIGESKIHEIFYWYFSENAEIDISYYNSKTEISECMYSIHAKKGWNKIYFNKNIIDETACYTTDLSELPDGLHWIVDSLGQL
jgi:hypothetical protein